jgi:hypothetical protein
MRTSRKLSHALFSLFALVLMSAAALAADPGTPYPDNNVVSDQKAGSVLFYNIYTSSSTAAVTQNTRINITNTSSTHAAFVHIYFVQDTCNVADAFICLTANQTASFLTNDLDPDITGYIVAVAVDPDTGCPTSFNFLIGDLYIKAPATFVTGGTAPFFANLAAEAFAARFENELTTCNKNSTLATMLFDNNQYDRPPLVLAVSNIPDQTPTSNSTLLILNAFGGSLATSATTIGRVFGIIYDDAENAFSFTQAMGNCQDRRLISTFRTTPRVSGIIGTPGRSGWMKVWNSNQSTGMLGSVINANPQAGAQANAFNGGHNLHKLTLTNGSYTVPVFPPSC